MICFRRMTFFGQKANKAERESESFLINVRTFKCNSQSDRQADKPTIQ